LGFQALVEEVDGNSEGAAASAAVHVVALSGIAALERGADFIGPTSDAAAGVASRQHQVGGYNLS